METTEKKRFVQMVAKAMAAYSKPLPETSILDAWWETLKQYPLRAVALAFAGYCEENGEFAPLPAGIAKRCHLMDGRPGAEEAWAIAILSQDEADTVVWTDEAAEAFAICQPVLSMGDEVGARMAFKESYLRIVARARSERRPVHWFPSLGWDTTKRTAALTAAVTGGLLPAQSVAGLLPTPAGAPVTDDNARMQLDMIKKMMAESIAAKQREFEECDRRQRDATTTAKARANALAASYGQSEAA
jgi:hypothetical protein